MMREPLEAGEAAAGVVVAGFGALAHETRLGLFRLLVRKGYSGETAGELARRVGIPPQTASFHLKEMLHAQLVRQWRRGRNVYYAVDFEHLCRLRDYLSACCCVEEHPGTVHVRSTP